MTNLKIQQLCILLVALTSFTCHAAFCDGESYSDWYCDNRVDKLKYCSCTDSGGRTTCTKTNEEICTYGCDKYDSDCKDADEVCGFRGWNDLMNTGSCSVGSGLPSGWISWAENMEFDSEIRTRQADADERIAELKSQTESIYNVTSGSETLPASLQAVLNDCDSEFTTFSCQIEFPKCKDDSPSNGECKTSCDLAYTCYDTFYTACMDLGTVEGTVYTCRYPEEYYTDKEECKDICKSTASSLAVSAIMLMSLLIAVFATF